MSLKSPSTAGRCCSDDELQALLRGQLSVERLEQVSHHVETCRRCQVAIDRLLSEQSPDLAGYFEGRKENAASLPQETAHRIERQLQKAIGSPQRSLDKSHRAHLPSDMKFGEYRILEEIGRGGMGTVYRAKHGKLGKVVALKILEADEFAGGTRSEARVSRFQRELRAIGRLDHPNIVAALDAGELGRFHYLVMEFVEGANLQQIVSERGPLAVADACEIARQVAIGLNHSHHAGLVHRDIKPSNIMLSSNDNGTSAKILDMGLARFRELEDACDGSLTRSGVVLGTINYLAPEQLSSHDVDIRADIFSLGATLHYLLTGRSPFDADDGTVWARIKKRTDGPAESIEVARPGLPPELVQLVDSMMAEDPKNRPPSPASVAEALVPFCDGQDLAKYGCSRVGTADSNGETVGFSAEQTPDSGDFELDPIASPQESWRPGESTASTARIFRGWTAWVLIGLVASVLAAAGIIVRLQTDGGEIVIECNIPDLQFEIVRNGSVVKSIEVGQQAETTWYRAGDYEIRIPRENHDQLSVSNQAFTLKRGETQVVTISFVAGPPSAPKPNLKSFAPPEDIWFSVESKSNPGKVLGVRHAQVEHSANVWLEEQAGADNQQFRFVPAGVGRYYIESKLASGYVVDVLDWGTTDQTNIQVVMRGETANSASLFELYETDDGYIRFVSGIAPGLRLGIADDGVNIVSRTKDVGDREFFRLNKLDAIDEPPTEIKRSVDAAGDMVDSERELHLRAAEMILARGARPIISIDQQRYWLEPGGPMPEGPFQIRGLWTGDEYTTLSDDDCQWLGGFSTIDMLDFHGADEMTSLGLQHFRDCSGMRWLALSRFQGKEGIETVVNHFRELRYFAPRKDVDEWMQSLQGNQSILGLDFYRTGLTDVGAVAVVSFPNLRYLDLADTNVGDHGFAEIARMRSLFYLVAASSVSDEGMRALFQNKGLRHLYLPRLDGRHKLSAELRAALPDCERIGRWNPLMFNPMMLQDLKLQIRRWPPPDGN